MTETIGFIGLGIMGRPMARNLAKAGYSLVLHNRSQEAVDELVAELPNARAAASPAEVGAVAETVITIVPDSPDVRDVVFGANGLIESVNEKTLLIDMSTIATGTAVEVHDAVVARGGAFLDAPVSGGDKGAIAGTLSVMVGGEAADFQRAMPLFEAMGKTIVHVGGAGAGQTVKACNQIVVAINYAAVSEALVLGGVGQLPNVAATGQEHVLLAAGILGPDHGRAAGRQIRALDAPPLGKDSVCERSDLHGFARPTVAKG